MKTRIHLNKFYRFLERVYRAIETRADFNQDDLYAGMYNNNGDWKY